MTHVAFEAWIAAFNSFKPYWSAFVPVRAPTESPRHIPLEMLLYKTERANRPMGTKKNYIRKKWLYCSFAVRLSHGYTGR